MKHSAKCNIVRFNGLGLDQIWETNYDWKSFTVFRARKCVCVCVCVCVKWWRSVHAAKCRKCTEIRTLSFKLFPILQSPITQSFVATSRDHHEQPCQRHALEQVASKTITLMYCTYARSWLWKAFLTDFLNTGDAHLTEHDILQLNRKKNPPNKRKIFYCIKGLVIFRNMINFLRWGPALVGCGT